MADVKSLVSANIRSNLQVSVMAQKKIKVTDKEVKEVTDRLFDYFDYFNSLTEDDTTVFYDSVKMLSQVPVPQEFSEFIIPSSVKLMAGNRRLPELLLRNDKTVYNGKSLSYSDYLNVIDTFRGFFKKSGQEGCITLESLKKEVSLSDIISRIQVVDSVNYDSDPYVPVRVIDSVSVIINAKFLQDNADQMIKDYCAKIRF